MESDAWIKLPEFSWYHVVSVAASLSAWKSEMTKSTIQFPVEC